MEESWKWERSILVYTGIYFVIFMCLKLLLNLCNIEFMQKIYLGTILIVVLGTISGIIQIIMKTKSKPLKATFISVLVAIIAICAIFWQIIALLIIAFFPPEHIVVKDNKKMVCYAIAFLHTRVDYYEYINDIIRGNKIILEEDYGKGGFDPLDKTSDYEHEIQYYTYYDENGKIIKTNRNVGSYSQNTESKIDENSDEIKTTTNNDTQESIDEYFKINDEISFSVSIVDYAMGKEAIKIYKSTDGNKTSKSTLKTENEILWVHYNSKFTFIDENTGFIYDPGRDGDSEDYGTIKVTRRWGANF